MSALRQDQGGERSRTIGLLDKKELSAILQVKSSGQALRDG
jgi:hypothetical protein